jgi:hypothetical protein
MVRAGRLDSITVLAVVFPGLIVAAALAVGLAAVLIAYQLLRGRS